MNRSQEIVKQTPKMGQKLPNDAPPNHSHPRRKSLAVIKDSAVGVVPTSTAQSFARKDQTFLKKCKNVPQSELQNTPKHLPVDGIYARKLLVFHEVALNVISKFYMDRLNGSQEIKENNKK